MCGTPANHTQRNQLLASTPLVFESTELRHDWANLMRNATGEIFGHRKIKSTARHSCEILNLLQYFYFVHNKFSL